MAEWNEMSINLLTSAFRQIAAFGKDPSEEEVEKVQLECVRMCINLMLFETFQRNIFLVTFRSLLVEKGNLVLDSKAATFLINQKDNIK